MTLTNQEMDTYAHALRDIFEKVQGKLGYVVSKNYRKLVDELQEYTELKNETITKYGAQNAEGTYEIAINSEAFKDYIKEMNQYNNITCEVNLVTIKPEDVYDSSLNAQEIMGISFMIEDEDEETK